MRRTRNNAFDLSSWKGRTESVRVLLEHGAGADADDCSVADFTVAKKIVA